MPRTDKPLLTERYDKAFLAASDIHRYHTRKGGGGEKPYMTHLLGVCAKVLDNGGSEDAAITAMLHDSIEDQSKRVVEWGLRTDPTFRVHFHEELQLSEREACDMVLARAFGERVGDMIEALTDEKVEWSKIPKKMHGQVIRENREHKFEKLRLIEDVEIVLVKGCDIDDNANSLLHDYQKQGPDVWGNFRGGRDGTFWYYEQMVDVLEDRKFFRLANNLRKTVGRLYDATTDERK